MSGKAGQVNSNDETKTQELRHVAAKQLVLNKHKRKEQLVKKTLVNSARNKH